jgi:hypothetical protein
MLIITDNKMPDNAKKRLKDFGDLLEIETSGITYPAISGHPDIFFCQAKQELAVAPNLPEKYFSALQKHGVKFTTGQKPVGNTYPHTSHYNAVVSQTHLIHNINYTDKSLLQICRGLKTIHVNQGYTRCNLISLNGSVFITSDPGFNKTLTDHGLNCHYFPPHEIYLEGFTYGFLGGACGILEQKLFVCGNLNLHNWGNKFRNVAENAGYEMIELCNTPLHDTGSIIFV